LAKSTPGSVTAGQTRDCSDLPLVSGPFFTQSPKSVADSVEIVPPEFRGRGSVIKKAWHACLRRVIKTLSGWPFPRLSFDIPQCSIADGAAPSVRQN
jgi:hypothetical protein